MTKRCCWGKDAANLDLSEVPSAIADLSKEIHKRSAVLLTSDVAGKDNDACRLRSGANLESTRLRGPGEELQALTLSLYSTSSTVSY